jgi:hypothetical protein
MSWGSEWNSLSWRSLRPVSDILTEMLVGLVWLVDELFERVSAVVCLLRNASDGGLVWLVV